MPYDRKLVFYFRRFYRPAFATNHEEDEEEDTRGDFEEVDEEAYLQHEELYQQMALRVRLSFILC